MYIQIHTHTHSVLMAVFPGEPGLAGCPLNSPCPFIPELRILCGFKYTVCHISVVGLRVSYEHTVRR